MASRSDSLLAELSKQSEQRDKNMKRIVTTMGNINQKYFHCYATRTVQRTKTCRRCRESLLASLRRAVIGQQANTYRHRRLTPEAARIPKAHGRPRMTKFHASCETDIGENSSSHGECSSRTSFSKILKENDDEDECNWYSVEVDSDDGDENGIPTHVPPAAAPEAI